MTEDKMFGWHHQLNGHEFEQAMGDGEGNGSLACCSPRGHKDSDMTELLKNNNSHYNRTRDVRNEKKEIKLALFAYYTIVYIDLSFLKYIDNSLKMIEEKLVFIIYSVTSWILLYSV